MELRKMTIDEYKQVITEMLGFVHTLCEKHNIRYFVAYGTLIGAVRHDGFIPWDDDIDIWMEASEYKKFVKVFSEATSDYYILSSDTSPYYYNLMDRICAKSGILKLNGIMDIDNLGPFIDIFRLHKAPEDKDERQKYFEQVIEANKNVRYSLPSRYYRTMKGKKWWKKRVNLTLNLPKRIKYHVMMGTEKTKAIRDKLVAKYDQTDSKLYYSVSESKCSDKTTFSEETINHIEKHSFENIEVYIPSEYDKILTRIFGDYMQLPPENKRVTRHHFTPYWNV